MQKKAGNNVMGMIRAAGLGYEYLRYEEEGQEPEVTKAIEDVSLEIQKGQFIAVLGHNGSGKSTLAKHINALLVPTEGTMWVDDMKTTDEEDVWKIRQKAGMVFQNPDNQIIGNVVEEDVGFGPENLGVPTDEIWKRVEESLTATGMISYRAHSPNKLSGGQKQRVAIAGVMAMQPECIVLDEPTSFLDIRHKIELLDILQEMAVKDNVAVIVSLHEIELAAKIADYVMCVGADGKIEFGRPEKIFTDDRISSLYGLIHGTYNCMYGSTELKKPEGTPKVFVAGGAGTGVFIYRELQRLGIAFRAGILYENDCDFPVAKALASEVITEKMFEPIGKDTFEAACRKIDESDYVIDTGCPVGQMNAMLKDVLEYAAEKKKIILKKPDIDTLKSLFTGE
jgi:iron complex transport system ATP-binding protein